MLGAAQPADARRPRRDGRRPDPHQPRPQGVQGFGAARHDCSVGVRHDAQGLCLRSGRNDRTSLARQSHRGDQPRVGAVCFGDPLCRAVTSGTGGVDVNDLQPRSRQRSGEEDVHVLNPGYRRPPPASQRREELPVAGNRVRGLGVDDPGLADDRTRPNDHGDIDPLVRPVATHEDQTPTSSRQKEEEDACAP